MHSRNIFVSIFLCFTAIVAAQDRSNYKLLWEITKNNTVGKSYVFGTMHLQDERVFQFSDSVIPAIKNTEIFALEIDPNIMGGAIKEKMESYEGTQNIYKEILSEEEYERLAQKFMEINGSSIEDFPISHPLMIESALSPNISKETDKRTFLDVYLFGVANHFNKEITGLEDLDDQIPDMEDIPKEELRQAILELIDLDEAEANQQLERLIDVYYQGSLEQIYYYLNGWWPIDKVMERRNTKMVKSLDSIMQRKTIFAGVGAAHLPGNSGVLDLLEKKGYTVRPVGATFNDPEFTFDLKVNEDDWMTTTYKEAGFSLKTPDKAIAIPMSGQYNIYTVADLYSGGSFSYFFMDYTGSDLASEGNIIDKVIDNQLEDATNELIGRKEISVGDSNGVEVVMKTEDGTMRAQYFDIDNHLFAFLVENQMSELSSPYVDTFFNSIQFFEREVPEVTWETLENDLGAYTVQTIGETTDLSRTAPDPSNPDIEYFLHLFSMKDPNQNTFNLFRYNDQPIGYYLNDADLFNEQVSSLLENQGKILSEPKEIEVDGVPGTSYEIELSKTYHARAHAFFRGNRFYLLLSQAISKDDTISENDTFLNSLKFNPYQPLKLDSLITLNDRHQIRMPQFPELKETIAYTASDMFESYNAYAALDAATGGCYMIQKITATPYLRSEALEKFYDDYTEDILEYNDTIIGSKPSTLGGLPSRQLLLQNGNSHIRQKIELLLDGRDIILLLSYVGEDELDRVDTYFNTFEINGTSSNFNLTDSKMDLFVKNLKSKDSLVFESAKGAFSYYIFDKSEEKALSKLLNVKFMDEGETYSVKNKIIDEIATLDSKKSLKTLLKFYKSTNASNNHKTQIMGWLPELTDKNALPAFFEFLQEKDLTIQEDVDFDIFNGLKDKPEVVVAESARLLSVLKYEPYRDGIVDLFSNHMKDSLYGPKLYQYSEQLLTYFETDAKKYNDTIQRKQFSYLGYTLISSYIDIAKAQQTLSPTTERALLTLADSPESDSSIALRALLAAIEKEVEIAPEFLSQKMENLYNRYEIMEALIDAGLPDQVPENFLAPIEYGRLSLYNAVGDTSFDYYPNTITVVGEIEHEEQQYFIYSFSFEDDDATYLGGVASTTIDVAELSPFEVYTSMNEFDSDNWKEQAIKMLSTE
ncbi:MAG TPA: TraB/GumN family protein [Flavobacteriaceae bacterium]|nr:TraB/GumN family protein [Flavobacteriaceae bacterium]HIN99666.1 TraB/GumN family protein [Flavobacteriaceae bacterium]